MALNNREAMLSGQEEEEEARILAALSCAVAAQSARIWQVRLALALAPLRPSCATVLQTKLMALLEEAEHAMAVQCC